MRCTPARGVEHAFNSHWMMSADWTHENGVHAYRRYQYQAGYTLFSPLFAQDSATQQQNVPDIVRLPHRQPLPL